MRLAISWLMLLSLSVPICAEVLLLANGNILEGQIRRARDSFVVQGVHGSVHVRFDETLARCHDLADAYRWKLARSDPRDIAQQIQLTQWCLTHGLIHEAQDRLLQVSRLDSDHAAIDVLAKQLRDASQPQPPSSENIQPVSAEQPDPRTAQDSDVDPMVLKQFTRTIQPLLWNRCGATTCHGSATKTEFKIVRPIHGIKRQEQTIRNLRATMAFIDSSDPDASELLEFGLAAHGPSRIPPLGVAELKKRTSLQEWIRAAAGNRPPGSTPAHLPEPAFEDAPPARDDSDPTDTSTLAPVSPADSQSTRHPFDPREFNAPTD
jgi:hypothetical protein